MTVRDFLHDIYTVADSSPICGIPAIRRLTASAINLRIPVSSGQFIDAFFNEQTGRTAFAFIENEKRLFGADNTGGWHVHPFDNPDLHETRDEAMVFSDFIKLIEARLQNKQA
ncbi:hypothetical protein HUU40_05430 [candidate division KSB1 bacterium]|nr:hypothetical protein [candidate division KSB1 bacterium]